MVVDTQFHNFYGRPFARVLYSGVFIAHERYRSVTPLDATRVNRTILQGCQSTPPGCIVQCVRGACFAVCVRRGHAPQSPEHYLLVTSNSFADRSHLQQKQPAHSAASASAAVHKAHGAVIDVAAAPCDPSAAYGHVTLPAFVVASR